MPVKTHNALCCKDRIDDNTVKLFKMGLSLKSQILSRVTFSAIHLS